MINFNGRIEIEPEMEPVSKDIKLMKHVKVLNLGHTLMTESDKGGNDFELESYGRGATVSNGISRQMQVTTNSGSIRP